jgi:hypothetical protein
MRGVGHVAGMGEMRNVYKIVIRKPSRKRSLGRHRHRWKDNNKLALRDI